MLSQSRLECVTFKQGSLYASEFEEGVADLLSRRVVANLEDSMVHVKHFWPYVENNTFDVEEIGEEEGFVGVLALETGCVLA